MNKRIIIRIYVKITLKSEDLSLLLRSDLFGDDWVLHQLVSE